MSMLSYYHSEDLDYNIGSWNEDSEEFDYSNELDVQDGEYEVFITSSLKSKSKKENWQCVGKYKMPPLMFGEGNCWMYSHLVKTKDNDKLKVVNGKFCAKQLSEIASKLNKEIKYWGCYLTDVKVGKYKNGGVYGLIINIDS